MREAIEVSFGGGTGVTTSGSFFSFKQEALLGLQTAYETTTKT